jgi:hypothetical protein
VILYVLDLLTEKQRREAASTFPVHVLAEKVEKDSVERVSRKEYEAVLDHGS